MDLLPWFRWLQNTPVGAGIRESPVWFPIFMTIHLTGITMLVGTILLMDLGLLGLGMKRQPVAEIASQMKRWTVAGALLVLGSGAFLGMARAGRCYRNPYFRGKMILLLAAAIFHVTTHRKVIFEGALATPLHRKVTGAVSLLLWVGAGFAGQVFTAF
jgi:hypothetical protein